MEIILDPGHGYGKAHNRGGVLFNEGDNAFSFALKLKQALEKEYFSKSCPCQKRIHVGLTRGMYQDPSLMERAVQGKGKKLFLSLHTNAGPKSATGVEIYDSLKTPNPILATKLCKSIAETLDIKNRGIRYRLYSPENEFKIVTKAINVKDYYGVLRHNLAESAMLIELCFHTNIDDSRKLLERTDILVENLKNQIIDYLKDK